MNCLQPAVSHCPAFATCSQADSQAAVRQTPGARATVAASMVCVTTHGTLAGCLLLTRAHAAEQPGGHLFSQQSICCKVSYHAWQGSSSPVGGTLDVCLPYFFEALSHMLLQQPPITRQLVCCPLAACRSQTGEHFPEAKSSFALRLLLFFFKLFYIMRPKTVPHEEPRMRHWCLLVMQCGTTPTSARWGAVPIAAIV